jgi:hypothetical protein
MKNFYIIMLALFLVNGASGQDPVPALPGNASAKCRHMGVNSTENARGGMIHTGKQLHNTGPGMKSWTAFSHKTPFDGSLIPVLDSSFRWEWDTIITGWKSTDKLTNVVYDARYNLVSYISQSWTGSGWENAVKTTYSYDANNNQTNELDQTWNSGTWVNASQYIYTYDSWNNQTSMVEQEWNSSSWENSWKITCTYDARNNLTGYIEQDWSLGNWVNSYKYAYTYDINNNQTTALEQTWMLSSWENSWQSISTYDSSNNLTSELEQDWNDTTWVNTFKFTYTYDASNNRTNGLAQYWIGSFWTDAFQYTYSYDADNNLVGEFMAIWNGTVWVNRGQFSYTYDENNFLKSFLHKYWNSDGTAIANGDSIYYYFHTVLGIHDLLSGSGNLKLYPNPSSSLITIETSAMQMPNQLSILNLNGQQVLTRQITAPKTQIDVSNLPCGVYIVRISDGRVVMEGKFIKME